MSDINAVVVSVYNW